MTVAPPANLLGEKDDLMPSSEPQSSHIYNGTSTSKVFVKESNRSQITMPLYITVWPCAPGLCISMSKTADAVYNRSNPPELIRFEVLVVEISCSSASNRTSTRKFRSSFELYLEHPERCPAK